MNPRQCPGKIHRRLAKKTSRHVHHIIHIYIVFSKLEKINNITAINKLIYNRVLIGQFFEHVQMF